MATHWSLAAPMEDTFENHPQRWRSRAHREYKKSEVCGTKNGAEMRPQF